MLLGVSQRQLKQCIGFVIHFKQDHEKCRHNFNFTLSRIWEVFSQNPARDHVDALLAPQKRSKPICSSSLVIINPFWGTPICTGGPWYGQSPVCTASPSAGNPWRQHSAVATSHVHPISRASNRQWWSSRYSRRPWNSTKNESRVSKYIICVDQQKFHRRSIHFFSHLHLYKMFKLDHQVILKHVHYLSLCVHPTALIPVLKHFSFHSC